MDNRRLNDAPRNQLSAFGFFAASPANKFVAVNLGQEFTRSEFQRALHRHTDLDGSQVLRLTKSVYAGDSPDRLGASAILEKLETLEAVNHIPGLRPPYSASPAAQVIEDALPQDPIGGMEYNEERQHVGLSYGTESASTAVGRIFGTDATSLSRLQIAFKEYQDVRASQKTEADNTSGKISGKVPKGQRFYTYSFGVAEVSLNVAVQETPPSIPPIVTTPASRKSGKAKTDGNQSTSSAEIGKRRKKEPSEEQSDLGYASSYEAEQAEGSESRMPAVTAEDVQDDITNAEDITVLEPIARAIAFIKKGSRLAGPEKLTWQKDVARLERSLQKRLQEELDEEEQGTGTASQPQPRYKFRLEQWPVWACAETNKKFWFRAQWYKAILMDQGLSRTEAVRACAWLWDKFVNGPKVDMLQGSDILQVINPGGKHPIAQASIRKINEVRGVPTKMKGGKAVFASWKGPILEPRQESVGDTLERLGFHQKKQDTRKRPIDLHNDSAVDQAAALDSGFEDEAEAERSMDDEMQEPQPEEPVSTEEP